MCLLVGLYMIIFRLSEARRFTERMDNRTTCISAFVHLILMIIFCTQLYVGGSIHKRKRCVEFEINDFKPEENPIKTFSSLKKYQCLIFCAHDRNCSAFNFQFAGGTCVLLPTSSPCISPDTTVGWLYVSLATCRYRPPWDTRTPDEGPWHWIPTNDLTRPDLIASVSSTNVARYVTRTNLRGMWVPGWRSNFSVEALFLAIDPLDHSNARCPTGQYLSWPATAGGGPVWQWINAGDSAPSGAVIGGYGPIMEPLYIARYTHNTLYVPGYYDPRRGQGHFKFNVVDPDKIEILINSSIV